MKMNRDRKIYVVLLVAYNPGISYAEVIAQIWPELTHADRIPVARVYSMLNEMAKLGAFDCRIVNRRKCLFPRKESHETILDSNLLQA